MDQDQAFEALRTELRAISDLDGVAATLDWDQATYLPEGGAEARGRQLALISELAHVRRTAPAMHDLLDACRAIGERDDRDGALVRRARERHERATRVPAELVRTTKQHFAETYVAWARARPANDFASLRPLLEKSLELTRRLADAYGWVDHPLDALIAESDRGSTVASIRALFASLRPALVPIVRLLTAVPPLDDSLLRRPVPAATQLTFSRSIAEAIGYDFTRGRMDLTHHPFMTRLSGGDVRITTRVREDDFGEAFFSTVHEVGHALYEQGIDLALDGTPLGEGASSGVHESQSRFWENFVARSRPFWTHVLPRLQAAVPGTFDDASVDDVYRAVSRVGRSLIRTDADEVTYNLHVMLRFDLECVLHEGSLRVADLPEAWNERMARDLGVAPLDDRDGVLQDVHWYAGPLGGCFQGYTIGNLLAAQLFEAAQRALPGLDDSIAAGDFARLRGFLRERVHHQGAALDPDALILEATGAPLGIDAFVGHLRSKYGPLHGLRFDA